jgi:hypothetical protein
MVVGVSCGRREKKLIKERERSSRWLSRTLGWPASCGGAIGGGGNGKVVGAKEVVERERGGRN